MRYESQPSNLAIVLARPLPLERSKYLYMPTAGTYPASGYARVDLETGEVTNFGNGNDAFFRSFAWDEQNERLVATDGQVMRGYTPEGALIGPFHTWANPGLFADGSSEGNYYYGVQNGYDAPKGITALGLLAGMEERIYANGITDSNGLLERVESLQSAGAGIYNFVVVQGGTVGFLSGGASTTPSLDPITPSPGLSIKDIAVNRTTGGIYYCTVTTVYEKMPGQAPTVLATVDAGPSSWTGVHVDPVSQEIYATSATKLFRWVTDEFVLLATISGGLSGNGAFTPKGLVAVDPPPFSLAKPATPTFFLSNKDNFWQWAKVVDAQGYKLEWGTASGVYTFTAEVTGTNLYDPEAPSYFQVECNDGSTYYGRVTAWADKPGGRVFSVPSDEQSMFVPTGEGDPVEGGEPPEPGPTPPTPTNFAAAMSGPAIIWSWDVVPDVAGYILRMGTVAGGPYENTYKQSNGQLYDQNAPDYYQGSSVPGMTYYGVVTAYTGAGATLSESVATVEVSMLSPEAGGGDGGDGGPPSGNPVSTPENPYGLRGYAFTGMGTAWEWAEAPGSAGFTLAFDEDPAGAFATEIDITPAMIAATGAPYPAYMDETTTGNFDSKYAKVRAYEDDGNGGLDYSPYSDPFKAGPPPF